MSESRMKAFRVFDLIGKAIAVLVFGSIGTLILIAVIGGLSIAAKQGLDPLLRVVTALVVIAVCLGGLLLGPRLVKSAWQHIGPGGQQRAANALVLVIGVAVMVAIYVFWQVPEIGDRPISSLTLNELLENVIKYGLLFLIGSGLLRFLFSK
jgi:hypothetical protein